MAEQVFSDSVYRFSDPIRFFKANDPYYFEVDNIPLKQLQENCLWLKDQLRQIPIALTQVKRASFDELKPYATGADRIVRVKPGRYTARVNDASIKQPLAFLTRLTGEDTGQTDSYNVTIPQTNAAQNQALLDALEKFKSSLAEDSLGLNGLETRVFTWPVYSPHTPIGVSGVSLDPDVNYIKYTKSAGSVGSEVENLNAVISEALVWVLGADEPPNSYLVEALINNSPEQSGGMSLLPRLESEFIKYWRGVARTAVVDIDEELTIEVPVFDSTDFSWKDDAGNDTPVTGVTSRIDLVFIYTKPIDASSTTIIKPSGKEVITKPQLGIVRGAGIKTNFDNDNPSQAKNGIKEFVTDEHKILASPGDSNNTSLGFTATSGSDLFFDIRGSFPSPDDILNLAPLISEQLEDNAIELVGQSILPVAYIWVKEEGTPLTNGSVPVLSTDVIDIRPFFRTTELAYNERAGIAAAVPQLSLANPAVGKVQMDYENVRLKNELTADIDNLRNIVYQTLEPLTTQSYQYLSSPALVFNAVVATLGTTASPKVWDITNYIPEEDREGLVSVQFRFISRGGGDDTDTINSVYMSGGSLPLRIVALWGVAQEGGDLRRNDGMANTFYAPVDKTQNSEGGYVLSFKTRATGSSDVNHYCYIDGYIVQKRLVDLDLF